MTDVSAPAPDVELDLDQTDRIVAIGGDWSPLAAAGVAPDGLLGSSLFAHVAGHFTRRFLRGFLEAVRESGEPARRRYRCDTPALKREMEMEVVPEGGHLRLLHRQVSAEPLPFDVHLKTVRSPAAADFQRCSVCNRLRSKRGGPWSEPELLATPGVPSLVIHTVCDDCRTTLAARKPLRTNT